MRTIRLQRCMLLGLLIVKSIVLLLLLKLLNAHLTVKMEPIELLSGGGDVDELLLKALLLLSEVQIGGQQLGVEARVHLFLAQTLTDLD